MKTNTPLSNCCQAPLKVINGNEGTSYWECKKCGRPADPVSQEPNLIDLKAMLIDHVTQAMPVSVDRDYAEHLFNRVIAQVRAEAVEEERERICKKSLSIIRRYIRLHSYNNSFHELLIEARPLRIFIGKVLDKIQKGGEV